MRLTFCLLSALLLPAQTFEVASVKPNPNCQASLMGPTPGRIELPCVTLRSLIRVAYGSFSDGKLSTRRTDVTGGPAWLDTDQFAVSAKAEGTPSAAVMMGVMLQQLLSERFQLKVHTEARETPVYLLTVSKPGKLTPAKEGSCVPLDLNNLRPPDPRAPTRFCGGPNMRMTNNVAVVEVPGSTMEEFAGRMLAMQTRRPVIDKTGLTDRYDLRLEYTPEPPSGVVSLNGVPTPNLPPPPADGAITLFVALQQQLGLKLTADKAPIPVIVVDSAAKPVEN